MTELYISESVDQCQWAIIDGVTRLIEQEECKKLRDACEKCECFRIINHPIPLTLMADMKLVAKHLYALPKEIKMRIKFIIPTSGYWPLPEINPLYKGLGIYDMHSSPRAV
ncbi:2-oxoglutarate-dependent dioxygenase DAO [Spatholobus suberectus]|nr:2-oxoglutarate-dependent dioxygenase DAO [Spatholobus suberectus]